MSSTYPALQTLTYNPADHVKVSNLRGGSVVADISVGASGAARSQVQASLIKLRARAEGGTLNLASVPVLAMTVPVERILQVGVISRCLSVLSVGWSGRSCLSQIRWRFQRPTPPWRKS